MDEIILQLEKIDPDMKRKRKLDEFKAHADIIRSKTNKDELFKLLKNLYTLCEWDLNDTEHEERKQLIKEVLKDINGALIDELVDQIYEMRLFSRKTRWKKIKSKCRKCFRQRCENRDQNDNY